MYTYIRARPDARGGRDGGPGGGDGLAAFGLVGRLTGPGHSNSHLTPVTRLAKKAIEPRTPSVCAVSVPLTFTACTIRTMATTIRPTGTIPGTRRSSPAPC